MPQSGSESSTSERLHPTSTWGEESFGIGWPSLDYKSELSGPSRLAVQRQFSGKSTLVHGAPRPVSRKVHTTTHVDEKRCTTLEAI